MTWRMGEWSEWLGKVNLNQRVAQQMIKIYDTPELNARMSSNLGMQALYEIATLPEPERTKEHTTSKGETKTLDEMTVKELRELKKQLKQRDEEKSQLQSQLEQAQRSESIAHKQREEYISIHNIYRR